MKIMVSVEKVETGYTLIASNGDKPEEGFIHPTEQGAQDALLKLYPVDSVWKPLHMIGCCMIETEDKSKRGRPPSTGEKLVQTAIWLRRDQLDWLKANGNVSQQMRHLIDEMMHK